MIQLRGRHASVIIEFGQEVERLAKEGKSLDYSTLQVQNSLGMLSLNARIINTPLTDEQPVIVNEEKSDSPDLPDEDNLAKDELVEVPEQSTEETTEEVDDPALIVESKEQPEPTKQDVPVQRKAGRPSKNK